MTVSSDGGRGDFNDNKLSVAWKNIRDEYQAFFFVIYGFAPSPQDNKDRRACSVPPKRRKERLRERKDEAIVIVSCGRGRGGGTQI